jgi:hypothetical protein
MQPEGRSYTTHRSSAIFPAFQSPEVFTRLIFLGYWQLKRQIPEIQAQVSIREGSGALLTQKKWVIGSAKAYQIELKEFIAREQFTGTIELEFSSSSDLVFPYPAVTVNYYGPAFSTVVHTAQRTYNDAEDLKRNSVQHVPESGFTIYSNQNIEPFVSLINGRKPQPAQTAALIFYNADGEAKSIDISLDPFDSYELRLLYLREWIDLPSFLKGKPGTCKLDFQLQDIFPRLLAGNRIKSPPAYVISHTYYDCSRSNSPSDFWSPSDPAWHPASLMFPIMGGSHFTSIDLYPIYSPAPFTLDLEIYDENGKLQVKKERFLTVDESSSSFQTISLEEFSQKDASLAARLIAHPAATQPIPARIKIAINIGCRGKGLPCNVCTNLQPYVPAFSAKKQSFKWVPFLADQAKPLTFIMNSSCAKDLNAPALTHLTFFRESDTSTISRDVSIPPQGFYAIQLDSELKEFFQGKVGWVSAQTSNPYTTTYYFAENPSGIIGGDHGF